MKKIKIQFRPILFIKKIITTAALFFSCILTYSQTKLIDHRVDSVLKRMTLGEKVGQMNQYSSDFAATGPITNDGDKQNQVRKGMIGSFLNVTGAARTQSLQKIAMQSRMKIPLLFGQDVIHGYRTTFPVPLAEAASWDMAAIQRSARIAATEVAASGVHWTFAPMVDIARDPRWGRVMEGAGEDPFLGAMIARARVKGFQGNGLGNVDAVMACAKHFAAYGAAVGGRDYNSVDMSLRQLHEIYLPPFKAALDAGVATFMNSFNDLNGIPATGNTYLQRQILKGQWNFKGFVVSDWGSVGEMINHGFAKNNTEAAMLAANAGSDIDMESRSYTQHLANLVKTGKVKMEVVDDAVRRILLKKFELGLFDDPYKFCNPKREEQQWNVAENLEAARDIAKKSIVLLKNENVLGQTKKALPVSKHEKSIAIIGPFAKAVRDHLGFWSYSWPDDTARIATIWQGIQNKVNADTKLLYAKGCGITDTSRAGFDEAVAVANEAGIIIICAGEASDMSGEAKSRSSIGLPGIQEDLILAIIKTGKPVIVLIGAGRPLIFNRIADNAPAILYTWWLGTQAGNAIADVLFGDYNPSGKLPISFPRTEGQIPVYYNHYNTGRPAANDTDINYVSAYIDLPNSPRFPFGYGLSYTSFAYSEIDLDKTTMKKNETITATVTITNQGSYYGEEVVQLYLRDMVASVTRPVKELKAFTKIKLNAGQSTKVNFTISISDLKFYNNELKLIAEPGDFKLFIGGNSRDVKEKDFKLQ